MGILDGFFSLGSKTNKTEDTKPEQGATGQEVGELSLEMSDYELIELKKEWEKAWDAYYSKEKDRQEANEKYWLGEHYSEGMHYSDRPVADNVIFEALETFLPEATSKNPEPMVTSDDSEEAQLLAKNVQKMLINLADTLRVKLRIKRVLRYWALYLVGAMKIGYSMEKKGIVCEPVRTDQLLFDPEGYVNDDLEFTGSWIGEYKSETAKDLIFRFPEKESFIKQEVNDKLGTKIKYMEWWTNDYLFWTLKNEVLDKRQNPHWNYTTEEEVIDEMGNVSMEEKEGKNHFTIPKMPYVLLGIFNLGKGPYDDTSLIGQNISNQDQINKRIVQIEKNTDNINNGWVISGQATGMNKEEAGAALDALRKGKGLYISQGTPQEAVMNMSGQGLPSDVFNDLMDKRNELRNIFGTRGSTPQGIMEDDTVAGKAMIRGLDSSRSGGGIGEYVEQFADNLYNWFVQMMYVYYDEEKAASVLGEAKGYEYIQISQSELFEHELTVSVKQGSMIPKDSFSQSQQAIQLAGANLLDPISMFDKLDYPNPKETAKSLFFWRNMPDKLFAKDEEVQQAVLEQQEAIRQAKDEEEAREEKLRTEEQAHDVDLKALDLIKNNDESKNEAKNGRKNEKQNASKKS